jgi:class 3 adenylate cyclase
VKITPEVKAFVIKLADKRCECAGKDCRHHLKGTRCKKGLRDDQWKVYWKKEDGGVTRENLQAWCLECFQNNFEVPSEAVTLLSLDVVDYARLLGEDRWKAITFKDALRDASRRAARERGGSIVLNRADDDVLVRLPSSLDAVEAARTVWSYVRDLTANLQVGTPSLRGGIHSGDVTTWRNGLVVGDAVEVASRVRDVAGSGEILLTRSAADQVHGKVPLEAVAGDSPERAAVGPTWSMRL